MNNDLHARMAQYEQELLNLRKRSQPSPPAEPIPTPPPKPAPCIEATMHLSVGSAAGNAPIHNAIVTVDRETANGRLPLYVRFTDRYGRIEPLALPCDQSARYIITAAAPGFLRSTVNGMTVDGGVVRRELWLQPLGANEEGEQ